MLLPRRRLRTLIHRTACLSAFAILPAMMGQTPISGLFQRQAIGFVGLSGSAEEGALEARGDIYSARRFLYQNAPASNKRAMLSRWASLEDWYGSAAPEAYFVLTNTLVRENAPKEQILEICRRGLQVSLRDEHFDAARRFARKSADLGDPSGLDLLQSNSLRGADYVTVLGGVAAFHSLVCGKGKPGKERFFLDYSRVLTSVSANSDGTEFRSLAHTIHEYFRQLTALAALGSRKAGRVEILLTLNDEDGRQRTETALGILGLKLTRNDGRLAIELAEGKSKAKLQYAQAALAIDEGGIQKALSANKSYHLEIPLDSVPVYPAEHLWQVAFGRDQDYEGGLAELFVSDPRLPRLYLALNSMDRDVAEVLLKAVSWQALAQTYSRPLSRFSSSLALNNNRAEVPGGSAAESAWQQLAGESPSNPAAFFKSLLTRDDGRLIAFFDALAHLDLAHQRFFMRSPDRAKRFYQLFRSSPEMRRGTQRLLLSALLDFFREVPLNDSGRVAFPGSPEVWMIAKGGSKSAAKVAQELKRTTAPASDDAILIRLATTENKTGFLTEPELANFIAVSRINRRRSESLSPEAALLLAQSYPRFGALFPYFSALGDLDASDFENVFTLAAKVNGLDFATANVRLGELHSYLAMLCLVEQSGFQTSESVRQQYRSGIRRYSQAMDAAAWTRASLAAIDDLAQLVHRGDFSGRDAAIQTLLIGHVSEKGRPAGRDRAYRQVLSLQKAPSLDALFTIRDSLGQLSNDPAAFDRIRKQISTFVTIIPPNTWRLEPQHRTGLERYQTRELEETLSKLHDRIAHRKGNRADIEKLSVKFLAELEPWVELAMAGQIYARYLDPSDLVVSADPLLLRKHMFASSEFLPHERPPFAPADFRASSMGEGSYFNGGFAEFSLAAGQARAEGNHLGAPWGEVVAGAVFASVRATDWRPLTESALQTFGANVRLAREWIVESATSGAMRQQLQEQSMGLLSLARRKALLAGVVSHDWAAVWESVSISDLYFLGKSLAGQAPTPLWRTPALIAMKEVATQPAVLDLLGQVAPDLSGSALPRLQHYQPYEEYERYSVPQPIAERVAELKFHLAWLADSAACRPAMLPAAAALSADAVAKKIVMRDMWDWSAVLDGFRSMEPQILGLLRDQ